MKELRFDLGLRAHDQISGVFAADDVFFSTSFELYRVRGAKPKRIPLPLRKKSGLELGPHIVSLHGREQRIALGCYDGRVLLSDDGGERFRDLPRPINRCKILRVICSADGVDALVEHRGSMIPRLRILGRPPLRREFFRADGRKWVRLERAEADHRALRAKIAKRFGVRDLDVVEDGESIALWDRGYQERGVRIGYIPGMDEVPERPARVFHSRNGGRTFAEIEVPAEVLVDVAAFDPSGALVLAGTARGKKLLAVVLKEAS